MATDRSGHVAARQGHARRPWFQFSLLFALLGSVALHAAGLGALGYVYLGGFGVGRGERPASIPFPARVVLPLEEISSESGRESPSVTTDLRTLLDSIPPSQPLAEVPPLPVIRPNSTSESPATQTPTIAQSTADSFATGNEMQWSGPRAVAPPRMVTAAPTLAPPGPAAADPAVNNSAAIQAHGTGFSAAATEPARIMRSTAPRISALGANAAFARNGFDDRGLPIPDYPAESRRRGEQGLVMLELEILSSGTVGEVRIITDSGHERLNNAAIRAAREARFEPATIDGQTVTGRIRIPYRFVLQK